MFTLKKIRNTLKLKKKLKIICSTFKPKKKSPKKYFELKSEKKKKIGTEQNNGRLAQHQAHGKPNILQRKQTYGFSKKNQANH